MSQLALHLKAELMWVPGHVGTRGNEIADELDRKGAEKVSTGLDPIIRLYNVM